MYKNMPTGDLWVITENRKESQWYKKKFRLKFDSINNKNLKDLLKKYIWHNYKVGNKELSTLRQQCNNDLPRFIQFLISRSVELKTISNNDIDNFLSELRTAISPKSNKPLSNEFQRKILSSVKDFIHWCQLYEPVSVTKDETFTGNEIMQSSKLHVDFIPDEVLEQINNALLTESNAYLKYGIIILQSTGMRIGDLLTLKIDCIKPHPINGYMLEWEQHKTKKNHSLPIRSEILGIADD